MGPGTASTGAFVGRAAELALLTERISAAAQGEGGVVLIGGEPGIGKTRLAAGLGCVRSRAVPDEGSPPYWMFRPALRDLPTTFPPNEFHHAHLTVIAPGPRARPPRLDGNEQRFAVFESVREYRDTETGGRGELTALLAALARPDAVTRISLTGLTQHEVGQQLAAVTGRAVAPELAAAIGRRSRGNPFFVGELARMTGSEPGGLPDAVRDTVLVRLHGLSVSGRDVLGVAAMLGAAVDPVAVAAVTGRGPAAVLAALDEVAAAGIIAAGGCFCPGGGRPRARRRGRAGDGGAHRPGLGRPRQAAVRRGAGRVAGGG